MLHCHPKALYCHRMETHLWAFEVYLLKGRLLLALSAVKRALALGGAADPTVHRLVMRFALKAAEQPSDGTQVCVMCEMASLTTRHTLQVVLECHFVRSAWMCEWRLAVRNTHCE